RLGRWLGALIPFALLAIAALILHKELSARQLSAALDSARGIRLGAVATAIALTVVSYLVLTFYDFLALRYIGKRLNRALIVFTAFIAYAFSHTISFASLTGAAIRYRLYAAQGVSIGDVARIAAFNVLTLGSGCILVGGMSLVLMPAGVAGVANIPDGWVRVVGAAAMAGVVAYLAYAARPGTALQFRGWSLPLPGTKLAVRQVIVGVIDVALACAVLWTLLPASANVGFVAFSGIYVIACTVGLLSHVPGGVGVFESMVLLFLPQVPRHDLLGALIAYRAIYYLAPLALALVLFAFREVVAQRARLIVLIRAAELYLGSIMPRLAAAIVFIAAIVLLLSGATPLIDSRLSMIRHLLPLPVLEISHLAGSAIGTALLILARALLRRVRAAYDIVFWLLLAGIAASLLQGLDVEEALLLSAILGVLYLGRAAFYRSSSLLYERFTGGWIASVAAVLVLVTCVGFFMYREVAYSNELWWHFALHADASRMLRGSLVAAIVAVVLLLSNLLGPPHAKADSGPNDGPGGLHAALGQATSSLAQAVLAGDKRVLMSDSGSAFVMYQVARRSWVALGDPVGDRCAHQQLVWKFRELSDRHGGWTVFYQVSGDRLPLYVDLGLELFKLGEEARVPLAQFSLDGSSRSELRHAHRRVSRASASFEIVPVGAAETLMPTLRGISQEWLVAKATAEKRFSVGSFSEAYLHQFPIALVRYRDEPVAFANVWTTPDHSELSVDLMRFSSGAPNGTMDFLFVELMLWARAEGFGAFNLGMAPLSGLPTHQLAPVWHRLGNFIYRHGEHFYNFDGLRRYKSKFRPVWEPRYLAAPGGLAAPRVLADISILIAGGLKELVTK
ncbi:bifunctional lysylphosphatidylglycerol flippase/synthetase MprF, partial [Povalibacter sp.]|uniref:bifunctional lysylphosphatidylglycerol flippase/synthetase MprF n=1 Tax=Povalibacter sp. TaxID=1962978 RepID=UPI002F3EA086